MPDFKVNNAKSVTATLYGWIDFDQDGVFSTDEATSVLVPAGLSDDTVTLNWNVPVDIDLGTTFIRLRLTTDSSVTTATPDGIASDGEVEDFALAVALDIPPDSNAISITTGETPLACQSTVFSDDFDDLTMGQFIGPHRGSATVTIRDCLLLAVVVIPMPGLMMELLWVWVHLFTLVMVLSAGSARRLAPGLHLMLMGE